MRRLALLKIGDGAVPMNSFLEGGLEHELSLRLLLMSMLIKFNIQIMETIDTAELVTMPIEQFKAYLQKVKAQYDQIKQNNNELNEKLHRQVRKEQRMKDENKQAIL